MAKAKKKFDEDFKKMILDFKPVWPIGRRTGSAIWYRYTNDLSLEEASYKECSNRHD
jgi:hypothetical protein